MTATLTDLLSAGLIQDLAGDDERLWTTVAAYHDASWKEFGLHGTSPDNPKQAVDLHFTYDEATSSYRAKLIQ